MTRFLGWLVGLTGGLIPSLLFGGDGQLQFAFESPGYVRHALVVGRQDFNQAKLVELAREFLQSFGRTPFAVLYVATDPRYLGYYMGQGATDVDFANWSHRLQTSLAEGWEPIPDLAEVNVISGGAVLRFRHGEKVKRVVLTGTDPLLLEVKGTRYEILEVQGVPDGSESSTGPRITRCDACLQSVQVFVRTKPPLRSKHLRELGRRLGILAKPANLNIHVRADAWFIGYPRFPMLYAFDEKATLPSYEQYRRTGAAGLDFDGRTGLVRVYGP